MSSVDECMLQKTNSFSFLLEHSFLFHTLHTKESIGHIIKLYLVSGRCLPKLTFILMQLLPTYRDDLIYSKNNEIENDMKEWSMIIL